MYRVIYCTGRYPILHLTDKLWEDFTEADAISDSLRKSSLYKEIADRCLASRAVFHTIDNSVQYLRLNGFGGRCTQIHHFKV